MNEYSFMSLATSFRRVIDGVEMDFTLTVDCKGKVTLAPLIPKRVQEKFPEGLIYEFLDEQLLIYPFKNK